jgi:hypothetical protein
MRKSFILTEIEYSAFKRLRPIQGEAISFWHRVARRRELDPGSIISNGETFTALPMDHGKQWCFPIVLKCKKKPSYAE